MRTATNKAVFTLNGKPLNVWDRKRDIVYKNEVAVEVTRLILNSDQSLLTSTPTGALDIEGNIEHLSASTL